MEFYNHYSSQLFEGNSLKKFKFHIKKIYADLFILFIVEFFLFVAKYRKFSDAIEKYWKQEVLPDNNIYQSYVV